MAYALGKYSYGICDRCGFRYPYLDLREEWNNFKVCPECYEPKARQLEPTQTGADAEALFQPRPDVPETDNTNLRFRWRSGGSDATASSYDWAISTNYGHSTTGLAANDDSAKINFAMGNNAWEGCQLELVIYPKSSAESSYQGNSVITNGFYETNGGSPRSTQSASFYDGGTTYYPDGFKFYMSSGNLATGDYALYGVKR